MNNIAQSPCLQTPVFVAHLKHCAVFILAFLLFACDNSSETTHTQPITTNSDRFKSMLRSIPTDQLLLTVQINDQTVIDAQPLSAYVESTTDPQIQLNITAPVGIEPQTTASIRIAFLYASVGLPTIVIADATQQIQWSDNLSSVAIDALEYQYKDNDNDGVYDFFQYSVSDNGLVDLVITANFRNANLNFVFMNLTSTDVQTAMLISDLSEESEIRYFDLSADGWPWQAPDQQLLSEESWHAFRLSPENASQCVGWDEEDRISSFDSSLNENAMAIFHRDDIPPSADDVITNTNTMFLPIGGNVTVDLAAFSLPFFGETPLDNGLEYILVREGVWGWIRVWSEPAGEQIAGSPSCVYNLSNPAIF